MRVILLLCCICSIALFPGRLSAGPAASSGPDSIYRPIAQENASSDPAREWEDEIFYVVLPSIFFNGDTSNDIMLQRYGPTTEFYQNSYLGGGYWGGDLAGVIQKLDYISDLGITTLFLYPIVQNDRHDFFGWLAGGYRPKDYCAVDENLGTTQTAKTLVDLAHERGIRVVLDMPLSLCGIENPYNTKPYQDAGWFTGGSAWGMPIWNADNPDTRDYLNSAGRFWRDTIGIDGYRLDSALLLSNGYWKSFADATRDAAHPDLFTMAEAVTSPAAIGPFLASTTLTSAYDWGSLRLQGVFGGQDSMEQITFFQAEAHQYYPNYRRMIAEVDNYPENSFIAMTAEPKEKRAKLALACLMTLDRIPLLYSGDEAALVYSDVGGLFAPENQNPEFRSYVKRLIAVRKQEAALRRGLYQEVFRQTRVIAYTRTLDNEQVLFMANGSASSKTLSFPVGGVPWKDLELTDLIESKAAKATGNAAGLVLEPYEAAILKVGRYPASVRRDVWRRYD